MHIQTYDVQSGKENFDIRFSAGEALKFLFENAPAGGERVVTVGLSTQSDPLIQVAGEHSITLTRDALDVVPEGRLCVFNLWQRDGTELDLLAQGRLVRHASVAPLVANTPFRAHAEGPLLLVDGDSVMHNMPGTRPFLEQMVGHKFRFPEGFLGAAGGDSAQDIMFGSAELASLIVPNETVVLVGPVGANQGAADDSFEEITAYLDTVYQRYLEAGALVMAVPTLLDGMGMTAQDVKKSALAKWVGAYGTGGTVSYLGQSHKVAPHTGFHAVDVSGFDRDAMKTDVSHPNVHGSRYLAQQIADVILPLVEGDMFAVETGRIVMTAAFGGDRAASAAGISGTIPDAWDITRNEGDDTWQCGRSTDGSFQVRVTDTAGDGTCVLTLPDVALSAQAGDVFAFLAEIDVLPGASGLKSVGVSGPGASVMTLNADWSIAPGTYFPRTVDQAYGAAQETENLQIFVRVAAGASVTVRFKRAVAFFVQNRAEALTISGTPETSVMVGQHYDFSPIVSGGAGPYQFDLAGGDLPAGLSLDGATGDISGVSSEVAVADGLALRVRDALGAQAVLPYFSLHVMAMDVPAMLGAPSIDNGAPAVGDTLVTDPGHWSNNPTGYLYQWLSSGAEISGATGATYEVLAQDLDQTLAVQIVAQNAAGDSAAEVSQATSAVVVAAGAAAGFDPAINTSPVLELAYADSDRQMLATENIAGLRHGRGSDVLAGKVYFEFALATQVLGVGVTTSGLTAISGGGFGTGRVFWSGSVLFYTGGSAGMGGGLQDGDQVQVAVDVDAALIWVRRNGAGEWNNSVGADPASGSGGRDISGLTGPLYAYAGLQAEPSGQVTLNGTSDRYAYAAPTGFNPIR